MNFEEIKTDLKSLKKFEVILFGSAVNGNTTPRSDIDIAVITRERNREKNKEIWLSLLGKLPDKFDVKVFELLPLPVQMSIIKNYAVVFGNRLDLSEYFYFYRKLWKDVEPRYLANQFKNLKEKTKAMANAAKIHVG